MNTPLTEPTALPKRQHLYVSLDQVRDSRLLSAERMAEVEAEIARRISIPRDAEGRLIRTARLADLSPWPRMLYPRFDHDGDMLYMQRDILAVVLTASERELLDKHTLAATAQRKREEAFEKARKVPASEWDGWVTDGDGYWDSVASYLDDVAEGDERLEDETVDEVTPRRPYLWTARPQQVITGRDVADVFESQICDNGWEDCDIDAFAGVEALQAALDAFVKLNAAVVSYHEDRSVAVMLEPVAVAKEGAK